MKTRLGYGFSYGMKPTETFFNKKNCRQTRLSRGGRGASSACACGVSPRRAFPAGVSYLPLQSTLLSNLEQFIKKLQANSFSESLPAVCSVSDINGLSLSSGNRYCCSLRFCKNMKHRYLFFNRLELKDLLNHITFLFDDGHSFQSYIKAS